MTQKTTKKFGRAFAIATGSRRANRRNRLAANLQVFALCAITFAVSCMALVPTVAYAILSVLNHFHESVGKLNADWGWYSLTTWLKEQLIENNDVAQFLSDCAHTSFGKFMQIALLIVGTIAFFFLIGMICTSFTNICRALQEAYFVKHRNSFFYKKALKSFLERNKCKSVGSKEMIEDRLYYVYKNEIQVMKLLKNKKAREAAA